MSVTKQNRLSKGDKGGKTLTDLDQKISAMVKKKKKEQEGHSVR